MLYTARLFLIISAFVVAFAPAAFGFELAWDVSADWESLADYDARSTFSNPNGEWFYGEVTGPAGIAARMEGPRTSANGSWSGFQKFFTGSVIGKNTKPTPIWLAADKGSAWLDAGRVAFDAGANRPANTAIIRWTAPLNARVKVEAAFTGNHIPTGDSDPGTISSVSLLGNDKVLWQGRIEGFVGCSSWEYVPPKGSSPVQIYTGEVNVVQGDTITFACDFSTTPAGEWRGLTGLKARISVVKLLSTPATNKPALGWVDALKPKGKPGSALTLASNGTALYTILTPWQPDAKDEKAAADLRRWLYQMTGADFPVEQENPRAAAREPYISIGRTRALASSGLPRAKSDLGTDGYAVDAKGGNLYLWGGARRGAINAVYALLEEDLGCRWYDRYSTSIPYRPELTFRPVPRKYVPVLDIRDPFYWYAFEPRWSLRNRTNAPWVPIPEKWGGTTDYAMFVHSLGWLLNPDQHFKDHPEYFALRGGKRTSQQPCLSNPEVFKIVLANLKDVLARSPNSEITSISYNDNGEYCECPSCAALDRAEGSNAGTLLTFANKIADAIKDEFPKVKISVLAYWGTYMPPKTVRPRPNIVVQLCSDKHSLARPLLLVTETDEFHKAMEAWARIGAPIYIWDYTTNFRQYSLPMPNMQVEDFNINYFIKYGAVGIMTQGAYESPGGENGAMRSWVWAKKLWDPSLSSKTLMKDFVFGYYREAAAPMWGYNVLLWNTWQRLHKPPYDDHNPLAAGGGYEPDAAYLTESFISSGLKLMAQAERLARTPETRRRVALAKYAMNYLRLSREIGYMDNFRVFRPGTRLGKKDTTGLAAAVDEFERMTVSEGVTRLAEATKDVPQRIKRWKDMLELDLASTEVWGLSNTWKFKTDPTEAGMTDTWYAAALDDSGWSVAHSNVGNGWEKQGFPGYTGFGWYRQRFTPPASLARAEHVFFYFGGVDEQGEVFINGKHAFDRTVKSMGISADSLWDRPFAFDAKPFIDFGAENTVSVRVHNQGGMGGIWRPVYLIGTNLDADTEALGVAIIHAGHRDRMNPTY